MVKKSNAKSADGYVNYGASLMAKGLIDEAIEWFQKALEINPTHFEATYNLGKRKIRKSEKIIINYIFQDWL